MKQQNGFTLIEYLVALGVLGIFAAAFFSFFSQSEVNYRNTEKNRNLYQIIHSESERIYGGMYRKNISGFIYKDKEKRKNLFCSLSKSLKDKSLSIYSYSLQIRKKQKIWKYIILNMEK